MTTNSDASSYSEDSYDDPHFFQFELPPSPSKTRKRRSRQCLCWKRGRISTDDSPILPSIHRPAKRGVGLVKKICSPFLFMICLCFSFVRKGEESPEMKTKWRFPLVNTSINATIVFGLSILLYELNRTSRALQFVSSAITWALFVFNIFRFFSVGLPTLKRYLGSTYGTLFFFDLFLSQTMSYAALGLSIWMLDTNPGKASQFRALGDETVSGYLAFMRLWISTVSTVFGPGHIPNLPVGVVALVWNFGSVINSVFFIIVVGGWGSDILDGLILDRRNRRRRRYSSRSESGTPRNHLISSEMEIPGDEEQHSRSEEKRKRKTHRKSTKHVAGFVEMGGTRRPKEN